MNNIFILDGQNDEILGHINKKYVIDNEHELDLPTHKDYFWFTVLAENKHAEHLTKRNGLIIPGEDGELLEFRIFESIKYRNNEGLFIEVHALATYLDLKTQKIFDPHKTEPETTLQHATIALDGTEWQVGEVNVKGIRTLEFDNPFNSYEYILQIAREFELETRFYIKTDGNKVTGRYVDLVERVGEFRGRTIEFGRDLQRIERKEDTSNIVTALWVYGPEREDGTRLKVLVEDDEARQRWGRRGQHIIDYYEPQTENQDITEERLEQLGKMELNKRINAVVSYEADIVDLEIVPGMENKKIRFGDTIRIKDVYFNPPLYVEARIFNVKRDVFNKAKKTVQLGDYVEYSEEEVKAIWKQLQQQVQQKISAVQAEQMIEEYAEPKKVESSTPPEIKAGDNPIWVDTSQEPYIPYVADVENNEWVRMTLSDDDVLVNEVNYNGLKWSKDEGLIVERSDGKVRSVMNGTDGIKVQQKDEDDNWVDVFFVDENGNVKFAGHLEGATGSFISEGIYEGTNNKVDIDRVITVESAHYKTELSHIGMKQTDKDYDFVYRYHGGSLAVSHPDGKPIAGMRVDPNGILSIYAREGYNGLDINVEETTIAGNLTANGMPFYEEGDWTPTIDSTGTSVGHAYYRREGRYVRQGNLVTVFFDIEMSVKSSSATGSVYIRGLPYAPRLDSEISGSIATLENVSLPSGRQWVVPFRSGSFIAFKALGDNVSGINLNIQEHWTSNSIVRGSATYRI